MRVDSGVDTDLLGVWGTDSPDEVAALVVGEQGSIIELTYTEYE